ncbi:MAG TPA: hypothetical protein VLF79_03345 [Candidatus Saccharimonadales bacterium]|nr:hypothetical protein [Candidatus Saccharimonadales bacterium]
MRYQAKTTRTNRRTDQATSHIMPLLNNKVFGDLIPKFFSKNIEIEYDKSDAPEKLDVQRNSKPKPKPNALRSFEGIIREPTTWHLNPNRTPIDVQFQ